MKKLVLLFVIITALVLSGCNPCKRLALKCPSHDSTTVVQNIVRDTMWLPVEADSIDLTIPIPVLVDLSDLGIIVEDAKQKVIVRIIHDTLLVKSLCKEDSLMAVIEHLEKVITHKKIIYQDVEIMVPVVKNGKFARFTMIAFFCCVVLLIGYIYLKVKSGAVKSVLNRL